LSGVVPNALVSPIALERMFGEELVSGASGTSGTANFRRKRRPRGPSSMFASEDLAVVQKMTDDDVL
jgi:hypothetical protein